MKNFQKGFTLSEILVVLVIIGILTAVAVPQYKRVVDSSRATEAQAMLRTIYDSSERLAGEYGYRSYVQLLNYKDKKTHSFARLDMFDADRLPAQCFIEDFEILNCRRFAYKIATNGYVAAKKLKNPYAGTYILLDRNSLQISCQGTAAACDVYGLDRNTTSNVSFSASGEDTPQVAN
ncbi:type IV pilin protein [Candidatus Avelusimicrobium luingense]|uniref:type IV pilin protein n=1 Tax=Candidatus Avelusimicrobium luingense TaxID=3416211 RepID=UPI003D10864A